jgi:CRP/FNR family transcriptional regulator, cyclic AMP receptor protein
LTGKSSQSLPDIPCGGIMEIRMQLPTKKFAKDEILFNEGDAPRSIFIIQSGVVAIRKKKTGGFIELARVNTNEVLGEMSFFDRQPRSADAVALTPIVEAIEIEFSAMEKIFTSIPSYMQAIVRSMADRLRKANDTIRRLEKNVVSNEAPAPGPTDDAAAALKALEEKKD